MSALPLVVADAFSTDLMSSTWDTRYGKVLVLRLVLLVAMGLLVRAVVRTMVDAGGTLIKEPQPAVWGGYHAFVNDPMGVCWEVAHNPDWSVAADGTVRIGTLEP